MLTFLAVAVAKDLIADLKRVDRVLAAENCDLREVGPYRDPLVIAGVLPAYRRSLEGLRAEIRKDLIKLGVNPDGGEEAPAGVTITSSLSVDGNLQARH